ncbi:hypothetical protein ABZZ79_28280 [Streptomyces sp. NPDC006458]|uniref:hypothetical protein n=1 Tax=Streptomyces sp. NPDC006458 TaxID=3154302 RepID=UPI0033B1573B
MHRLTGRTDAFLTAIRAELRGGHEIRAAAQDAAGLAEAARELVPELRAALGDPSLDRNIPRLDADTALAEALWRVTGDASEAVTVLGSVLATADEPWHDWPVIRAARAAARLGPSARPLRPLLEQMLGTSVTAPAAALALLSAASAGQTFGGRDRGALAALLLDSAERDEDAGTALEALTALGAASLPDEAFRRLAALSERDLRVVRSGLESDIVRRDEDLRARARATLAGLVAERGAAESG